MRSKLPSRFLTTQDEITQARQSYRDQHFDFFGPDGVAANFGEDVTHSFSRQAWKQTLTPPDFVQESWMLIMLWAFWCMWSEYTLPMFLGLSLIALNITGWIYFGLLSPLLRGLIV